MNYFLNNIFKNLFLFIIFSYQKIISPMIPARCRYYPTCSEYGLQAIGWYGAWRGSRLLLGRLARCQPFGGHGVDFVPLPMSDYRYDYVDGDRGHTDSGFCQHRYVYRDHFGYTARLNRWMTG